MLVGSTSRADAILDWNDFRALIVERNKGNRGSEELSIAVAKESLNLQEGDCMWCGAHVHIRDVVILQNS
jgi:hypothetical protein